MIEVSCIIINYNTSNYTLDAVKSILETHDSLFPYEIIIIDNASERGDYEFLKNGIEVFQNSGTANLKLVRSKQNLGFGGGNMLGVQHAAPCNYYAFINNDTLQISENCLKLLSKFMKNNKKVGLCSPQMLDSDMKFRVTIDHFASLQREIISRPILEKIFPEKYPDRKRFYTKPTKVQYVQGSFMFVDTHEFHEIGGFDTNLFLYYEESDVCRRLLKERRKSTYLIPELQYIHYKSASTKINLGIKIEQKISLLYYIRKHFGFFHHEILLFYFIFRYFFTTIVKPQYLPLFMLLLKGAPITESLKLKQKAKVLP